MIFFEKNMRGVGLSPTTVISVDTISLLSVGDAIASGVISILVCLTNEVRKHTSLSTSEIVVSNPRRH